jgi:hypothetical protein
MPRATAVSAAMDQVLLRRAISIKSSYLESRVSLPVQATWNRREGCC